MFSDAITRIHGSQQNAELSKEQFELQSEFALLDDAILLAPETDVKALKTLELLNTASTMRYLATTIQENTDFKPLLQFINKDNLMSASLESIPALENLHGATLDRKVIVNDLYTLAMNMEATAANEGLIDWAKRNRGWATFLFFLFGTPIIGAIFGNLARLILGHAGVMKNIGAVASANLGLQLGATIAVWAKLGELKDADTIATAISANDLKTVSTATVAAIDFLVKLLQTKVPSTESELQSMKSNLKSASGVLKGLGLGFDSDSGKIIAQRDLPEPTTNKVKALGYGNNSISSVAGNIESIISKTEKSAKMITDKMTALSDASKSVNGNKALNADQKKVMIEAYAIMSNTATVVMHRYMAATRICLSSCRSVEKAYKD